jgi:DNA-binding NtrC family response regulator
MSFGEERATSVVETKKPKRRVAGVVIPKEGINLRQTLREIEAELIRIALEKTDDVTTEAAKLLSINRTTLVEKMKRYRINRDDESDDAESVSTVETEDRVEAQGSNQTEGE